MACGVAIFVNFLIFAQFGYLERLRHLGHGAQEIRVALGIMGVVGLVTSLLAPVLIRRRSPLYALRLGLVASLLVTAAATVPGDPGLAFMALVSGGIGLSIALTAVSLQSVLRQRFDAPHAGLRAGLGTGLAYLICNVPGLFDATPVHKAAFACATQLIALVSTAWLREGAQPTPAEPTAGDADELLRPRGFTRTVAMFLAIIWLDSAAFYIIQTTPDLRDQLWGTAALQWQNGVWHLLAAIVGGWWLDRHGLPRVLALAYVMLVVAVVLMHHIGGLPWLVAILYVSAVSVYSTGLAAYGTLGPRSRDAIPVHWRVGILFAVAGWLGSALGVGMAQDLREVPEWFMAIAGLAIVAAAGPRAWMDTRARHRGPAPGWSACP
jgi:cytochrome c oxidase cbb3-type subunit 2